MSEQPDRVIALNPPRDGRHWDNQCGRCGSSLIYEDCDGCGGEGLSGHDCGEDTCCCLDPEDDQECDWCEGRGGYWRCCSSAEWCQSNPQPNRESVASGYPEWFTFDPLADSPTARP